MQLWAEINVVTLNKLIKTTPRQMCVEVRAKSGSRYKQLCDFFFGVNVIYVQLLLIKNNK